MFYMNIGNVPLFILSLMHYLIYEGILRKSSRFTLNSKKSRSFHFEFLENVFVPLRVMSLCMYMNNSKKQYDHIQVEYSWLIHSVQSIGVAVQFCLSYSGGKIVGSTNTIVCMSSECTLQL